MVLTALTEATLSVQASRSEGGLLPDMVPAAGESHPRSARQSWGPLAAYLAKVGSGISLAGSFQAQEADLVRLSHCQRFLAWSLSGSLGNATQILHNGSTHQQYLFVAKGSLRSGDHALSEEEMHQWVCAHAGLCYLLLNLQRVVESLSEAVCLTAV